MADQKVNVTEEQRKKLDDAKKQLAANREAQAKMSEQEGAAAGKPTPTQEENDLAKLGAYLPEHEADGSPEQPMGYPEMNPLNKQAAAKPAPSNYQTRTVKPAE